MVKYLQSIKEEEEHEMEANELTMEMIALGMDTVHRDKKTQNKKNPQSVQISRKGSMSNSFADNSIAATVETDEQRQEREKQEFLQNFRVMTNDEYKN